MCAQAGLPLECRSPMKSSLAFALDDLSCVNIQTLAAQIRIEPISLRVRTVYSRLSVPSRSAGPPAGLPLAPRPNLSENCCKSQLPCFCHVVDNGTKRLHTKNEHPHSPRYALIAQNVHTPKKFLTWSPPVKRVEEIYIKSQHAKQLAPSNLCNVI